MYHFQLKKKTETINMPLVKHTPEKEIKMLQSKITQLENKDIKGFIARMERHYEIKKLKSRIKELQKSLPTQK